VKVVLNVALAVALLTGSAYGGNVALNVLIDDTAAKAGTYGASSVRPIALSNDEARLYVGYLMWGYFDGNPDTTGVYEYNATTGARTGQNNDLYNDFSFTSKGLAVDSAGNIYSNHPDFDQIIVIKPDLTTSVAIELDIVVDGDMANDGNKEYDPEGLAVYGNRLFFATDAGSLGRVYALDISQFTSGFDLTDTMALDLTWGGGDGYAQMAAKNDYGKMAVDDSGNIYVPNEDGEVWQVDSAGNDVALPLVGAPGCDGVQPVDVAVFDGDLYVAFNGNDGTLANAGIGVYDAGTGAYADFLTNPLLNNPEGVAISSDGYLYVSQGLFGQEGYVDVVFVSQSSLATAIPEPISMIFFGTGVVGVFGFITRRKMRKM